MSDNNTPSGIREGSLAAPTRHPVTWQTPEFYHEPSLFKELERVFDICHGCRRCFSLCNSFPTLFDAIDESKTGELESVDKKIYWQVVDHCYLCDMCYMTKCPYVPPHPWNVDFPHLMLRAKAVKFQKGEVRLRDKILSATEAVGNIAGIPVIAEVVNAVNRSSLGRQLLDKTLGVHPQAPIPHYHSKTYRKQYGQLHSPEITVQATAETTGKVALFVTCYGNRNEPALDADLRAVFEHNGIPVVLAQLEACCGMPKLELGDLKTIEQLKNTNIPALIKLVEQGYDIVTPIPSCTLMFKQELPLMFPDDALVQRVKAAMFDPFEYLWLRHKGGLLKTQFAARIGKVSYHVPCHLRVQNIGLKTRDVLRLIPDTQVMAIERCSGHNGTYGVKSEFRDISMKIGAPVVNKVADSEADYYASDCPMAGHQIRSGLPITAAEPTHPMKLLRMAYGI